MNCGCCSKSWLFKLEPPSRFAETLNPRCLVGHLDKIHPSSVRERDVVRIRPVIELDSHSLLVNGQHRRRYTFVPGPAVIVNNPPALFDLIQSAPQFHVFTMPDRSRMFKNNQSFSAFLDHRASAALRAAALRCAGVMLAVLAGPPRKPPSRPSATAAGFFLDFASLTMSVVWHALRTD